MEIKNNVNQDRSFFIACRRGQIRKVRKMIEEGFDVNTEDKKSHNTGLSIAVKTANIKIYELLLSYGADIYAKYSYSSYSIFTLSLELMQKTLVGKTYDSDSYSDVDLGLDTSLDARKPYKKVFELVLDECIKKCSGHDAIFYRICKAIYEDNLAAVRSLLEETEDHSELVICISPVFVATFLNRIEFVKYFLSNNFNFCSNKPDIPETHNSITVIETAITLGFFDIAKVFLDFGYDPNKKNECNQSLVHFAIEKKQFEFVKYLIKNYQIQNSSLDDHCHTVIQRAVFSEDLQTIEYILDSENFVINFQDMDGITALHLCCYDTTPSFFYNNLECKAFALLLEHGADPCLKDSLDSKPLHSICGRDDCEVLYYYKKVHLLNSYLANFEMYYSLIGYDHWNDLKNQKTEEFQTELNNLKNISIGSKSLYDYLFLNTFESAQLVDNPILCQMYKNNNKDFRCQFPHYGFRINFQYRRGIKRFSLNKTIKTYLDSIIGAQLPHDICNGILENLNDRELERLKYSIDRVKDLSEVIKDYYI